MAMEPYLSILLSLLAISVVSPFSSRQSAIATSPLLHINQIKALKTMNIPISTSSPCSDPAILCDDSVPFCHLVSLSLYNCPYYLSLDPASLQSLSTLKTLVVINCPVNPQVDTTPLSLILENLKNLTTLTISNPNLNESLPKNWGPLNLTHIELSNNELEGEIPDSIRHLNSLESLSLETNYLNGDIPSFIGDMKNLKYLNLENNTSDTTSKIHQHDFPYKATFAVRDMAIVLSGWILVIAFIMLLANCST